MTEDASLDGETSMTVLTEDANIAGKTWQT
jgi:hypothetical protein